MATHLQLIVPDYEAVQDSDKAPLAYIRLGASVTTNDTDLGTAQNRGDNLLTDLRFKDDWRSPVFPDKPYFRDDGKGVVAKTSGDRIAMSNELLTRGGWREHSDGNRISTTRGDCVEVVGGNYKLIVLGRVANNWDAAGLGDAGNGVRNTNVGRTRQEVSSGGHYNESTSTPGEVISITWDQDKEDGTWKTIEQTDHGDTKAIFKGYKQEHYFGPSVKSEIGTGTDEVTIEADFCGKGSKTGSDGHDGPGWLPAGAKIKDITYARSQQTQENINEVDDYTWVWGSHRENTTIKTAAHSRELWKTSESYAASMFFIENLVATDHNVVDAFSGWRRNYEIGAVSVGFEIVGFRWKKVKGVAVGINFMGTSLGLDIGVASASCTIAATLGVKVGQVLETSNHAAALELKLTDFKFAANKSYVFVFRGKSRAIRLKTEAQWTKLSAVNQDG